MSYNDRIIILTCTFLLLFATNFSNTSAGNNDTIPTTSSSQTITTDSAIKGTLQNRRINGDIQNRTSNALSEATVNNSDFRQIKTAVAQANDETINLRNPVCDSGSEYVKRISLNRIGLKGFAKKVQGYSSINRRNRKKEENEVVDYDYANDDGEYDEGKRETSGKAIAAESDSSKTFANVHQNDKREGEEPKIWDQWGKWSCCNTSCGPGKLIRWRHCIAGGCASGEKEAQLKSCQIKSC